MSQWQEKVVLVTGGSAGLGKAIAQAFGQAGARVVIAARDPRRLQQAGRQLSDAGVDVTTVVADVTRQPDVGQLFAQIQASHGRLDVLVNNVGKSARGRLLDTTLEAFHESLEINFLSAVQCTRAAIDTLAQSRGHIVNIGSLASKSAARFLGPYPSSKFSLAAFSQQLRYELAETGVHVLLVCPGPIARDATRTHSDQPAGNLPSSARKPGGGVHLSGLDPNRLARQIVRACERRRPELVVPAKARLLFAIAQLSPTLGDWIVNRMTQ